MPPPGYYTGSKLFSLRKEFVIFPKRLLSGGWAWGIVYHRRVNRLIPPPYELKVWYTEDEYFTEDEAVMAILEGE